MLIELIKEFQITNPGLVRMMKECNHHFSPTDLNDWHMCGDVWTHTCLVYKKLMELDLPESENTILGIIALCHDIGKIYVRQVKNPGKVSMYGHSFASIQDTIEFIKHLTKNTFILDGFPISDINYYVLNVISNHMDFKRVDEHKKFRICNNDSYLYQLAKIFEYCDGMGSICEKEKEERLNLEINELKEYNMLSRDNETHEIIFMCGSPASGKDTTANCASVSLDEVRLSLYPGKEKGKKERYIKAFEYCNENQINLNQHLIQDIEQKFAEGNEMVAVCNTNLTRKLRRSTINLIRNSRKLKNKSITAFYLCCDKRDLYRRDLDREDKTVGKQVIDKFLYNQQIPTVDEGFENIIFLEN